MTKELILSQGKTAVVDDADFDWLARWKWTLAERNGKLYAYRMDYTDRKRNAIYLHRLIMSPPSGMTVDHINGNGLDNRRSNLRVCSQKDNVRSRKNIKSPGMTSIYKGVSFDKRRGKWQAGIMLDNRRYFLGYFDNEEDAACAYDQAATERFGEFAITNFKVR